MPLTAAVKQYTGKEKTCVSLVLGTHRVKFFRNSSIEGEKYDKITKRYPWSLFDIPLPVTLVTETCRFYETEPRERSPVEAERAAEQVLTEQLQRMVEPYGAVRSTLCASCQRGGTLTVTLTAECEEEIGESVPIYTEDAQE